MFLWKCIIILGRGGTETKNGTMYKWDLKIYGIWKSIIVFDQESKKKNEVSPEILSSFLVGSKNRKRKWLLKFYHRLWQGAKPEKGSEIWNSIILFGEEVRVSVWVNTEKQSGIWNSIIIFPKKMNWKKEVVTSGNQWSIIGEIKKSIILILH